MYTYPRLQNLAYPARVLSDEGALSRGDPSADRARAGRAGAPRNGRWIGRWSAGRRCALPWARAVALPREVGRLIPPPRVPRKHPGASHRSIPSRGCRGKKQTSDALRRENVEAWLFEILKKKLSKTPQHTLRHTRA